MVADRAEWEEPMEPSNPEQIQVFYRNHAPRGSKVVTHSTPIKVYRKHSLAKSISAFFFLVVLGVGLMAVKVKGLERITAPKVAKAPARSSQGGDVLSAADALEWRQEFLWHRTIAKICPNPWIDDKPCARVVGQL